MLWCVTSRLPANILLLLFYDAWRYGKLYAFVLKYEREFYT